MKQRKNLIDESKGEEMALVTQTSIRIVLEILMIKYFLQMMIFPDQASIRRMLIRTGEFMIDTKMMRTRKIGVKMKNEVTFELQESMQVQGQRISI